MFIWFDAKDLPMPKEEQLKLIGEAQKWLNTLSLNVKVKDDAFLSTLNDFTGAPLNNLEEMRDAVLNLSTTDDLLFPNAVPVIKTKLLPTPEPAIHFAMQIDNDFRKEQLIKNAVDIPTIYNFQRPLSQLTQSQRQLLSDIYFSKHKKILGAVNLPMPTATSMTDGYWFGRINPTKDNHADILKLWEHDYRDAQNRLNESTSE